MRLNGWTTKVNWIDSRRGNIFVSSPVYSHRSTGSRSLIFNGQGLFPGGDTGYSPPPWVEVQNTWSYTSCVPCALRRAREELLPLPTYTQPAFTQGHAASHPSDMACVGTKSTHQLHTSTAPRHASRGWKSSQTVNDPAMSGEANRSIYAGWRTKPRRTFILHVVTWTNLWNSSSPKFGFQTTLRLEYELHVSRGGHQDEKQELKQPISKH